jgi:peroxiredoxin Q/BCP
MKIALLLILPLLAWLGWRALHTGPLPEIGAKAPDFRLADQHGQWHALSDYAGRWLVLYFYPRDDTPGCTREACVLRDGLARLHSAGATVVGVSVDEQPSHRIFAEKYQLPFSLLADSDGSVARKYGALMDWEIFRMAKRITFLINPKGEVQWVFTRVDPNRHADEILEKLQEAAKQVGG